MKEYHATIDTIAVILLLIGGINWGFVGLFDFDIIGALVGFTLARIIFVLMGAAGTWQIICWFQKKNR